MPVNNNGGHVERIALRVSSYLLIWLSIKISSLLLLKEKEYVLLPTMFLKSLISLVSPQLQLLKDLLDSIKTSMCTGQKRINCVTHP